MFFASPKQRVEKKGGAHRILLCQLMRLTIGATIPLAPAGGDCPAHFWKKSECCFRHVHRPCSGLAAWEEAARNATMGTEAVVPQSRGSACRPWTIRHKTNIVMVHAQDFRDAHNIQCSYVRLPAAIRHLSNLRALWVRFWLVFSSTRLLALRRCAAAQAVSAFLRLRGRRLAECASHGP